MYITLKIGIDCYWWANEY